MKKEKQTDQNRNTQHPFKNSNYQRPTSNKKGSFKNLKQILLAENYSKLPTKVATYVNIEAPPSLLPPKKYCDVSGLIAPYTDPKTKLRYSNAEMYRVIRQMTEETINKYLELRKAAIVLK